MQTSTQTVDNDLIRDAAKLCADQQIGKWLLRNDAVPDVELELREAGDGFREWLGRELTTTEKLVFSLAWYGAWDHIKTGYDARKAKRHTKLLKLALSLGGAR